MVANGSSLWLAGRPAFAEPLVGDLQNYERRVDQEQRVVGGALVDPPNHRSRSKFPPGVDDPTGRFDGDEARLVR